MKCLKCYETFSEYAIVNGKERQLTSRKYCLKCSPFGHRNTKRLHLPIKDKTDKQCPDCGKKFKWTKNNVCSTCRMYKRRHKNRNQALDYLGKKCNRCGHSDTDVLTFHHKNEQTKSYNLSRNWHRPWKIVIKEIKKCELLCANCHMKLHRKENL